MKIGKKFFNKRNDELVEITSIGEKYIEFKRRTGYIDILIIADFEFKFRELNVG